MYSNVLVSIWVVGNIFFVVFYVVVVMVIFMIMICFVDEEWMYVGIFKVLGYCSKDIIVKFFFYGLVVGIVGMVLGSMFGYYLLVSVILSVIMKGMVVGEI